MAMTQVAYEVEGWGVGELVAVDGLVVWHDLPWPRPAAPDLDVVAGAKDPSRTPTHPGARAASVVSGNPSRQGRGFVTEVVQMLQAYFAGRRPPLDEVPVDLEYETDFLSHCAAALRAVPRGEVVTYGELAAL
ncbi:MAG TPA: hypothetical protein VKB70_08450, partial [Gaiellaceae bacterium]|nr:hypothetical protein [Gaiellaceae bacterium]